MTDVRDTIRKLRELLEKATPRPWRVNDMQNAGEAD